MFQVCIKWSLTYLSHAGYDLFVKFWLNWAATVMSRQEMTSRQLALVSLLAKLCCRANCWKQLKSGVDECTGTGYSRCPASQKWPTVCHWHQTTKTWTGSRRPPPRWRWSRRAGSDRTKLASWWETTCSRATRCWTSAVTCAGWVVTRLSSSLIFFLITHFFLFLVALYLVVYFHCHCVSRLICLFFFY